MFKRKRGRPRKMKTLNTSMSVISNTFKNDKAPLVLAVIGQAYAIGLWQWNTSNVVSGYWLLNLIVAVITAWALDAIIVSTAFHKKTHLLHWFLALATSIVILVFSIAIAVEVFNDWRHAAFAVIVFLYSWFLAVVKSDIGLEAVDTTNRESLIRKLIPLGLDNSAIYSVVGGNKNKMWTLMNDIRNEALQSPDTN